MRIYFNFKFRNTNILLIILVVNYIGLLRFLFWSLYSAMLIMIQRLIIYLGLISIALSIPP